jgi:hypothetical protein
MNTKQKVLFIFGLFAAILCGAVTHQWLAVGLLWIAFDSLLARRRPGFCLVNTLGTLGTATIVQEALDMVFTKRPLLKYISMGFTDDKGSPIALFNQQVITRTKSVPAVGNFGDALPARADVDVPVTLNQFKQVGYSFTPQEYSGTNRDLIRESAEPLAIAFANAMVDAVASNWTPANFANKSVLGAGWSYNHITQVRAALNKRGVPVDNRFYVGNSDVCASLLNDPLIVSAFNNPANGEAIRRGLLPQVGGLGNNAVGLDEYPDIAVAAGSASVVGFSGTPDSTVYAHRIPKDPREILPNAPMPGSLGVVTEPKTGLSVMVLEYIALPALTANIILLWMYGTAVGRANNGQLITNA